MAAPCDWELDPGNDCCPGWDEYPAEVQARAITLATFVMWTATGRRYGACPVITRPCGNDRRCGECGFWTWGGGWMQPLLFDGIWRNCLCDCACDCKPRCQITLPGPVQSVTEVLVDGVILGADFWRVDDNQYLVRTDGECWPRCQDYNVDVPATGTLQVSYLRGDPIPPAVIIGANILACEFAKLCTGAACRLPSRIQTLVRQGVSISFVDIDLLLARGFTGITEVDQIIAADNPNGRRSRPFFYSYDTSPRTRTVTQA